MEIRISLKGESDTLWLNGKELTIESASAVAAGGEGRHRRGGDRPRARTTSVFTFKEIFRRATTT